MTAAPLVLLAGLLSAQMTQPPSVAHLCESFLETTDPGEKMRLLSQVARTPVTTPDDVAKLLDVFVRDPEQNARAAVLSSVELADPRNRHLDQAFVAMIKTGEPEPLILGMRGAARIKTPAARPMILELAKRTFSKPRPEDLDYGSERDAWWAQYEALYAISRIDGEKAYGLVKAATRQTPLAGRVLALAYWERALPLVAKWSKGSAAERALAEEALTTVVPTPALRAARERMLAYVRDPKAERELRHQLALKVGMSSTEPEVESLLAEHDKASDGESKLMLAAAVFASRAQAAVPLLARYLKESAEPSVRAGALAQLKDALPPAEYRPLLEWAADHDPDPEQRQEAARELSRLPP